jgi:hypothetical protein
MKTQRSISLLILFSLTLLSPNLFAQKKEKGNQKHKERFEAFKEERKAYITKEMDLTTEEAQAFWSLCDELDSKKFELNRELRKKKRESREAKKNGKEIADEVYKEYLELRAEVRLKEAELDKEYLKKFLEVIPAKKIAAFYKADQDFGKKMMEKRHKKENKK